MKEYILDTLFIYATVIGSIVAVLFVFIKKRRVK